MNAAEREQVHTLQLLASNLQTILRCLAFGANVKTRPTLTITQMRVLSFFNESDVIHVSDISRRLDMSLQSVNNLMSRLEAIGYVVRSQNSNDRRLTDIRLTEEGRASIDSFQRLHIQHMQGLMRCLSEREQQDAAEALERAALILEKAEGSFRRSAKEEM